MIDREYAHHIQFSADWSIEGENSEGSHTVDVYDADMNTLLNVFFRFVAAEYQVDDDMLKLRVSEWLEE